MGFSKDCIHGHGNLDPSVNIELMPGLSVVLLQRKKFAGNIIAAIAASQPGMHLLRLDERAVKDFLHGLSKTTV